MKPNRFCFDRATKPLPVGARIHRQPTNQQRPFNEWYTELNTGSSSDTFTFLILQSSQLLHFPRVQLASAAALEPFMLLRERGKCHTFSLQLFIQRFEVKELDAFVHIYNSCVMNEDINI